MSNEYIEKDAVITIIARKHLFKDKTDFDKCVHEIAKQVKALEVIENPVPMSVIEDFKAELHTLWDNEPCVTEHGCDKEVYDLIDRKVNEVTHEV